MLNAIKWLHPWLISTALSILLIASNDSPQVDLLKGKVTDAFSYALQPISKVISIVNLYEENHQLRTLVTELSLEMAEIQDALSENKRLREMLDLSQRISYELIAGEVIGTTPDPGVKGIIVNRGSVDGVKHNAGVINPQGVVGRVYRVSDRSCLIQLLIDPNIGIAGTLYSNREQGITKADIRGRLRIEGIPMTSQVTIDDLVLTTGIEGIFPGGLRIGKVNEFIPGSEGWLWNIKLTPAVSFNKLEEVFIMNSVLDDAY